MPIRDAKQRGHTSFLSITLILVMVLAQQVHFAFTQVAFAQAAPIPPVLPNAPAPENPISIPAPTPPPPSAQLGEITPGEERNIAETPILRLKGKINWDDGFATLTSAFNQLQREAKRLNLTVSGLPHLYFIESDSLTFTYEAYLKLNTPLDAGVSPMEGIEAGRSPSGRTFLFPYEGAYDEIDAAYEAIAAWLDDKGLTATGRFVEEYITLPTKPEDANMRVTIYVFVK